MVTGASTAEAAVILIDARKGVLTQTRPAQLPRVAAGHPKIVVAVNKLDLVDYSRDVFERIEAEYRDFAAQIGLTDVVCIPMSAPAGRQHHRAQPLHALVPRPDPARLPRDRARRAACPGRAVPDAGPVGEPSRPRLPWLLRGDRRRTCTARRPGPRGAIRPAEHGRAHRHDGRRPRRGDRRAVGDPHTGRRDRHQPAGRPLRGRSPAGSADQFEAHIVWMAEHDMLPGRPYLLKLVPRPSGLAATRPKYRVDVNTSSTPPPRRSRSTRSGCATSTSTGRSRSTLARRTATWAGSC